MMIIYVGIDKSNRACETKKFWVRPEFINRILKFVVGDDTNFPLEESDGHTVFVSGDKVSQIYEKQIIWYVVLETSLYFILSVENPWQRE